ncbi:interferon-induced protein with tetratricopeptide repeats 5-like [Scleropages formosus]|uniref:Interferon-induced protein with tetratricopeptide repeats 5-like n=1 Tax=Scleropages formosus TaxID=113540 RepID=A0A8C9RUB8_SCLFO|nr:interferon-induced protein with tetratricopeptide repeats 5-like [Scleropages formosus]
MSGKGDISLKTKLLRTDCHFTWGLSKNDIDIGDLQQRIEDDIKYSSEKKAELKYLFSFLAFTKYLQDLPEEALEDLKKAEEDVYKHKKEGYQKMLVATYGDFAWLYYHMGDYSTSQTYLAKLEDIKKQFPPSVLQAAVNGEKGWTFLRCSCKNYEKAKECFRKALEEEPDDGEWNAGYAIALYRTEWDATSAEESQAVKQLRRALELNPEDALIMVLLGLRLCVFKKMREAEDLVEKALEISPDDPHVTRYVAKFYRQSGSLEKSVALLKKALEKAPSSAFLHHQIAICYKIMKYNLSTSGGQARNSAETELVHLSVYHLETAVNLRPSFIFALTGLAASFAECGDLSRAEEMFQNTAELARAKNDNLQTVYRYYGDFLQYQKKSESLAIKQYMEGSKMQADTREGKKCISRLHNLARKRIYRNPEDGEAFGILGYVHRTKDEKREAIECYEKALLLDLENEEYLSALCDLRLSLV